MAQVPLSYCGEQVRRFDHDRYLTCLFAPADRREALFSLYAFNHEVAKTGEVVSEPMLGQIRLQWWRESLGGIYGGAARDHAVVQSLAAVVARHGLDRARIEALIDARALDLEAGAPETLAALVDYAEGTSGGLVQLALEVLGETGEAGLEAGRQVGIAWALCGLLRALPFHARRKRIYLPQALQRETGLDLREFFELRPSAAVARSVRQVADEAERRLRRARQARPEIAPAGRSALMLGVLAEGYLRRLGRAGYDPFDAALAAAPKGNAWRLAFAALRRTY